MTIVEQRPEVRPLTEEGEPRVAHIVRKKGLTEAFIEGTALEALCGAVFVPTRNPEQYPVCPACADILKAIKAGRAGNN